MRHSDFETMGINKFTAAEIIATGAALEDVDAGTIYCLQNFRVSSGIPVNLVYNGITTGKHKNKEHSDGKAVDVYFTFEKITPSLSELFIRAAHSGFNGIGIYHNSKMYSMHLDTGDKMRTWIGYKKKSLFDESWQYANLINDPKLLSLGGQS